MEAYFSHLSEELPQDQPQLAVFHGKRSDLFVDLLQDMADASGYKEFDKTRILKEGYATRYHQELEEEQNTLRKRLIEF